MPVNSDKTLKWNEDVATSVDFYNGWFMKFAPEAYRKQRRVATKQVEEALKCSANLTNVTPKILTENPSMLAMLRMATAPPIARDRLIGLAGISSNLVDSIETKRRLPPQMDKSKIEADLQKISRLIMKMADRDIFTWIGKDSKPSLEDVTRASLIIADRLCGSQSDPIIRNAQEQRQFDAIREWLRTRGYQEVHSEKPRIEEMEPGTFTFHLTIPARLDDGKKPVNIPIDVVIMPKQASTGELPLLIEAKSAGDFTNTNKRRKEEATKMRQLRETYDKEGKNFRYILFLCGYFDSGYLGYEAAARIDWVWEHRIGDLAEFGV